MRRSEFCNAVQGRCQQGATGKASSILTPRMLHAAGLRVGSDRASQGGTISETQPLGNTFIGDFALAATVLGVAAMPPLGPVAALILLTVLAAISVDCAIKSLFLSVLASFINPGLGGGTGGLSIARWVLIAVAFFTAARSSRPVKFRDWVTATGITFFLLACGIGIALSPFSGHLSMARMASFILGLATAFMLAKNTKAPVTRWLDFVLAMLAMIVMASMPLLAHPLGRLRSETGFQGVLSHPQTFGILVGLLPIIAISQIVSNQTPLPRTLLVALAALGSLMLWESEARTAILSLLFALALGVVLRLTMQRPNRHERRNWSRAAASVLIAMMLIGPLVGTGMKDEILDFLVKRRVKGTASVDSALQSLAISRQSKVEEHLWTIARYPEFGAGFGIDPFTEGTGTEGDALLGIPLSSPIEPGVMPLAIAAQTGLCGLVSFSLFTVGIARQIWRSHHLIGTLACLYFGGTSFGEGYAFSIGGLGLYLWLFVAIFYFASGQHHRQVDSGGSLVLWLQQRRGRN